MITHVAIRRPGSASLHGNLILVSILVIAGIGCASDPKRPTSLDKVQFPSPKIPNVEQSALPSADLAPQAFPQPVIKGEASRTVDDVTVDVAVGPYDQLKPHTRKWMAEQGIYMFKVTLTNRSAQTSDLDKVNVRLVVGDERVAPIGLHDRVGGDTTVASGRSDANMLEASYAEWRKSQGVDPSAVAAVFDRVIAQYESESGVEALLKKADVIHKSLLADIAASVKPDNVVYDQGSFQRAEAEWIEEANNRYTKWHNGIQAAYESTRNEIERQKQQTIADIDKKMQYDLDKVSLSSQNLKSVTLLPDGDKTTVFLAFQAAPAKVRSGGRISIYGVPVQFDAAGNVAKRTNVEFAFEVR